MAKKMENKPTPEEILTKYMNKLPPEYVTYIPKRERDRHQFTLEAMQEYAELFHKEKLREELVNYSIWTRGDFPAEKEFLKEVVSNYLKTKE